jgi:hypothetical protein
MLLDPVEIGETYLGMLRALLVRPSVRSTPRTTVYSAFDEHGGCAVGSSTPTAASCPTKNFLAISRSSAMALDFATCRATP